MAPGVLFHHPSSLQHDTGRGHPERPERVLAAEAALDAVGWLGLDVRQSPPATEQQLQRVHPAAHVASIAALCAAGGGAIDADTVCSPGSYEAALHAAGGACALVDSLLAGGMAFGAAVHRPPGHHAEADRAMGFCLFNNVAVAARHAIAAHGAQRVLIVDWDVHHGNGTNDIFRADDDVLFVSIHQSPLYPGSGPASDVGSGAGVGFTVNLPVPSGSGDAVFRSLIDHVVVPLGERFDPGLILISAGFDAHADDPLAGCEVTDAGYSAMASSLRDLAGAIGVPLGVVLEGGYDLGALSRGLVATLSACVGETSAERVGVVHPLAAAARERLGF